MRFAAALLQEMEIGLFARKAEALNPELASESGTDQSKNKTLSQNGEAVQISVGNLLASRQPAEESARSVRAEARVRCRFAGSRLLPQTGAGAAPPRRGARFPAQARLRSIALNLAPSC